jgi:hypothetical protein
MKIPFPKLQPGNFAKFVCKVRRIRRKIITSYDNALNATSKIIITDANDEMGFEYSPV